MFKEYDPLKEKIFQVMDNDGNIMNKKYMPEIEDDRLVKAFKDMLFARTADDMAVSYQRQGRMYTYPPNNGQEAIHQGLALNMRDQDWLTPAFRELGAWLAKGATMKEVFLYFMGYEDGTVFKDAPNMLPISVPIASQLIHGAGLGYAMKYKNIDSVVYSIVGDGGTSTGDFHEALNFASVWKVPVVFLVQNNQFAISVPFSKQQNAKSIAIKSVAYGIPGLQVDGNDLFAMDAALKEASKYCREGNGHVLIEAVSFRKGAHTTSDDPTKYRTKEEEQAWEAKDPIDRLRKYLVANNLYDASKEEELVKQFKKEVDRQFEEAENYPAYELKDVFDHLYAEKPQDLIDQQRAHEKFLKWKEEQK